MGNKVQVMGYEKEFYTIDLDLMKNDRKTYDIALLVCHTEEATKGFKVVKVCKTTKKGTKIRYAAFEDKEDSIEYEKKIKEMATEINNKYPELNLLKNL